MMKTKEITENLIYIRENVAKIEQHLKDMNGKLIKHEDWIECNRNNIGINDQKVMKYIWIGLGGVSVFWVIIQLVLERFIF